MECKCNVSAILRLMAETEMVCSKTSDILSSTLLDCLELKTKINYMNQIRKYLPVFKLLKPDFNLSNIFTKISSHHMQTFFLKRGICECCKKNYCLWEKIEHLILKQG
jgi:hypothetical protein